MGYGSTPQSSRQTSVNSGLLGRAGYQSTRPFTCKYIVE